MEEPLSREKDDSQLTTPGGYGSLKDQNIVKSGNRDGFRAKMATAKKTKENYKGVFRRKESYTVERTFLSHGMKEDE